MRVTKITENDAWSVGLTVKQAIERSIAATKRSVGREHFAAEHADNAINQALRELKARSVRRSENHSQLATDWICLVKGVKLYIRYSSEYHKLSVSLNPIVWK